MQANEFCRAVLGFPETWHVKDIEVDQPSNRINITLTYGEPPKKRFFSLNKEGEDIETVSVRHTPMFNMRTYLIIPSTQSISPQDALFSSGSKFTHAMEAFTQSAVENCKSLQAVASITGLTAAEIRDISSRLGIAIEKVQPASIDKESKQEVYETQILKKETESAPKISVPDESDDCWRRLLNGEIDIGGQSVALKMLLQKVRQQISNSPGDVAMQSARSLLRKYFLKNQHLHREELVWLNSGAPQRKSTNNNIHVIERGLPFVEHDCWQRLIDKQLPFETKHVSLQMMLEKIRQSIEKSPDKSSRLAGARVLRQFFVKHQRRLQPEIQQLGVEHLGNKKSASQLLVPHEKHQCWDALLDGGVKLPTKVVGLQMMMERVRLSVQKNPSIENRMAGIKILRQYLVKHQSRHQKEIHYLTNLGISDSVNQVAQSLDIPSENHESWQKLIDGKLTLDTEVVALQMMLERIRITVENNPGYESRLAGAKILRQYFIKHQRKHRSDINKLIAA